MHRRPLTSAVMVLCFTVPPFLAAHADAGFDGRTGAETPSTADKAPGYGWSSTGKERPLPSGNAWREVEPERRGSGDAGSVYYSTGPDQTGGRASDHRRPIPQRPPAMTGSGDAGSQNRRPGMEKPAWDVDGAGAESGGAGPRHWDAGY